MLEVFIKYNTASPAVLMFSAEGDILGSKKGHDGSQPGVSGVPEATWTSGVCPRDRRWLRRTEEDLFRTVELCCEVLLVWSRILITQCPRDTCEFVFFDNQNKECVWCHQRAYEADKMLQFALIRFLKSLVHVQLRETICGHVGPPTCKCLRRIV